MVSYLKDRIKRSAFLKNALVLLSGSAFAQAIPILLSPLITRIFLPSAMGLFGTFSSFSTYFGSLINLRFDQAIQIPREDEKADNLLRLGVICAGLLSTIIFIVLLLLLLSDVVHLPSKEWVVLIPLFSFSVALSQLFVRYAVRKKQFKRVSIAAVAKAVVTSFLSLIIGYAYSDSANILVFSLVVAQIAQLFIIVSAFDFTNKISWNDLRVTFNEFSNVPRHYLPASAINAFSIQLPIYFLICFFGESESGQYFHAHRILTLPITLFSASVGQVFFQRTAEQQRNNQSSERTVLTTFKSLFSLGIGPICVLLFFGDKLFPFVFGEEWAQSGVFVMCLAPWGLMLFAGSPIINLVSTHGKEKSFLYYNLVLISLRCIGLTVGLVVFNNVYYSVVLYGVVSFFSLTVFVVYLLRSAGIKQFRFLLELFGVVFAVSCILYLIRISIYA